MRRFHESGVTAQPPSWKPELKVQLPGRTIRPGLMGMNKNQPGPQSHLFTVRLWVEALGDGQTEWRGQVQHVVSKEKQYFRDWPSLLAFLRAKLQELEGGHG